MNKLFLILGIVFLALSCATIVQPAYVGEWELAVDGRVFGSFVFTEDTFILIVNSEVEAGFCGGTAYGYLDYSEDVLSLTPERTEDDKNCDGEISEDEVTFYTEENLKESDILILNIVEITDNEFIIQDENSEMTLRRIK
jgi:hypothetical protein